MEGACRRNAVGQARPVPKRQDTLPCRGSRHRAFRAPIGDHLRTGATRGISGLQVPPAVQTNGTLGKREGLVETGGAVSVFADDDVGYAAPTISPLDARRPLASAGEPKPFFRGTALARQLDESGIDHDPIFRKRDRAVGQNNPNQARACFALPARAKDR